MKKGIWIYCFLMLLSFASGAQSSSIKLKKVKVTEDITLALPQGFELMSDNMYARKYGAYRQPIAMYTDAQGNVDFGINETVNRSLLGGATTNWSEEDFEMIKGLYKASIAGMHSDVKFIQDKVQTINKRKYIVLEFVGSIKDEEKTFSLNGNQSRKQYSYIQYAIDEGKILVFNFTCPQLLMGEWQGVARDIMQTINIKNF